MAKTLIWDWTGLSGKGSDATRDFALHVTSKPDFKAGVNVDVEESGLTYSGYDSDVPTGSYNVKSVRTWRGGGWLVVLDFQNPTVNRPGGTVYGSGTVTLSKNGDQVPTEDKKLIQYAMFTAGALLAIGITIILIRRFKK